MAKISLAGFKDPVRRPRYIIWTGVAVLVLAAVMIVALGVTSTYWFCANGCHKVQDDTIIAYNHSTHSKIGCMSCHMPVGASPVVFILHKAEALGELYQTVTNKYELPLNGEDEVALKVIKTEQCTQCHNLKNRVVTPSAGIRIDHDVHLEKSITCTLCHNRIAHREDFELTKKDPKTGANRKHPDFMKMTACFRCHGLEEGSPAPGTCSACHPADFELKPPSHKAADFFPKGHADLAKEMKKEVEEALKETGRQPVTGESKTESLKVESGKKAETIGEKLAPVNTVFYCGTCHKDEFCSKCHGTEMPHSAEFKEPKSKDDPAGHPALSKTIADKCVMCHDKNEKSHFCDDCHHGKKVGTTFDPKTPWTQQHPKAVASGGIAKCLACHEKTFCVACHTKNKVLPASHKAADWIRGAAKTVTAYGQTPAKFSAKHPAAATASIESCEICHGDGGANAAFCKSCHKYEMPHKQEFKQFHADTGRKDPAGCRNCHSFNELCSNCHHTGSSLTVPWVRVHGGQVGKIGAAGCVEKCHKKTDCVACHTKLKAKPASHAAKNFVRDYAGSAAHTALFKSNGDSCTYCHQGDAATLPTSAFCKACHKLDMPHAIDSGSNQKFVHKDGFQKKQFAKATCLNCHAQQFCDNCHHKGAVTTAPWLRYHPNIVKANGAQACFECHQETFCSNCHVNLAKRGLLN